MLITWNCFSTSSTYLMSLSISHIHSSSAVCILLRHVHDPIPPWRQKICSFEYNTPSTKNVEKCHIFNTTITYQGTSQRLSSDNDPLFQYHQWQANLRILETREIKSIAYTPISHPFFERLIGTIWREYFNHIFFWNAQELERKLGGFLQ
jgi:putative transposase